MKAKWQKMLSPNVGDSAYKPLYSRYSRKMGDVAPKIININGDNNIKKARIKFSKSIIICLMIDSLGLLNLINYKDSCLFNLFFRPALFYF